MYVSWKCHKYCPISPFIIKIYQYINLSCHSTLTLKWKNLFKLTNRFFYTIKSFPLVVHKGIKEEKHYRIENLDNQLQHEIMNLSQYIFTLNWCATSWNLIRSKKYSFCWGSSTALLSSSAMSFWTTCWANIWSLWEGLFSSICPLKRKQIWIWKRIISG